MSLTYRAFSSTGSAVATSKNGLSPGLIAVIAILVALCCTGILFVFVCLRRRRARLAKEWVNNFVEYKAEKSNIALSRSPSEATIAPTTGMTPSLHDAYARMEKEFD